MPAPHHQGRPPVDDQPMIEHDAAAAVRCEHDRLLPSQQSRQHGASIRRQPAREVGGHHRQWTREDIGQDQIIA
jgi:hypothetical protein